MIPWQDSGGGRDWHATVMLDAAVTNANLPTELQHLLRACGCWRGLILVGGCVRDALLGIAQKDFSPKFMAWITRRWRAASAHGRVDWSGKSFGVIKFFQHERRAMGLQSAAPGFQDHCRAQRDLKVGIRSGYFAQEAAVAGILRLTLMFPPTLGAVSRLLWRAGRSGKTGVASYSAAFVEDPLPRAAGIQFAARFDLTPASETVELCRSIVQTFPEVSLSSAWDGSGSSGRNSANALQRGLRF